ncbi:hypothetical protein PE067_16315 [Paracoccus sp. DMF-8]|uniref:hypothetical protein n=1 Tax=Paracoccus sp. DMF-8 TaxID=3019445 RepID=UPI0023E3C410|nr:hypothetical protein [Paracoccus sp. DMF-8]MDF3607573.1 hypothetical protein [Paracoccus sp. DMF-8]
MDFPPDPVAPLQAEIARLTRERDEALAEAKAARAAQIAAGHVFADTNPEAKWIEDSDNACPACGGSGHKDDAKAYEDRAMAKVVMICRALEDSINSPKGVVPISAEPFYDGFQGRIRVPADATAALNRVQADAYREAADLFPAGSRDGDMIRSTIIARADAVERGV